MWVTLLWPRGRTWKAFVVTPPLILLPSAIAERKGKKSGGKGTLNFRESYFHLKHDRYFLLGKRERKIYFLQDRFYQKIWAGYSCYTGAGTQQWSQMSKCSFETILKVLDSISKEEGPGFICGSKSKWQRRSCFYQAKHPSPRASCIAVPAGPWVILWNLWGPHLWEPAKPMTGKMPPVHLYGQLPDHAKTCAFTLWHRPARPGSRSLLSVQACLCTYISTLQATGLANTCGCCHSQ